MQRASLILLILALGSLAGACSASGKVGPSALAGTEWTLVSLHGEPLIGATEINLYFEDRHLGGTMTCNGYGGPDRGQLV